MSDEVFAPDSSLTDRIQSNGASSSRLLPSSSWDPFSSAGCLDPMYSNEALLHQPSEFSVDLPEIPSEDELPHIEVDKLYDNSYMLSTDPSIVAPTPFVSADRAAANKRARMTSHRHRQYVKECCQLGSVSLSLSDEFITLLKLLLTQLVGLYHQQMIRLYMDGIPISPHGSCMDFVVQNRTASETARKMLLLPMFSFLRSYLDLSLVKILVQIFKSMNATCIDINNRCTSI